TARAWTTRAARTAELACLAVLLLAGRAPAQAPDAEVEQARFQPRAGPQGFILPDPRSVQIQLAPPGPERVFPLGSEEELHQRMRQEAIERDPAEYISFPEEPILSTEPYRGRNWPEQKLLVEPNYVCYKRLFFEERNSERYGWDLGPLGPEISA